MVSVPINNKLPLVIFLIIVLLSLVCSNEKQDQSLIKAREVEHAIENSPLITGCDFNPQKLVQVVNILQPMGKEKVLSILHDYVMKVHEKNNNSEQRVLIIIRVLFVHKDNMASMKNMPRLYIGGPDIYIEENSTDWPLFPLALVDDIPFLLINGYVLIGVPESPLDHIEYCEKHCKIRDKPLRPADNPLLVVDSLISSIKWKQLVANNKSPDALEIYSYKGMLRCQALRMVESVYPTTESTKRRLWKDDLDKEWENHIDKFSKLNVFWDSITNDYKIKP